MNKRKIQLVIKRALDVLVSFMALIALSPLLFIIGIVVVTTSKGSALFFQRRLGVNGKPFEIWKFRTMYRGAHQVAQRGDDGAILLSRTDSRITHFGRLLRESSLDELPQLWNVLKGDMSLVGPRPDEEIALQLYSQSDRAKLSMRPGITGLAMVSGRNRLAWQRRIELDIEYCTKFSLWLDVIIIIKTVKILIFREGIYSS